MSSGISKMFTESNRQVRQGLRGRIFREHRLASVRQSLIFAALGAVFWGADWVMDSDHVNKALLVRGAILAVLLFAALVKWLSNSLLVNFAAAYTSLFLGEAGFVFLASVVDGGILSMAGELLYFFIGSLLLCSIFPFNYNLWACLGLVFVPIVCGVMLIERFPPMLYASVLLPGYLLTMMLHWRTRYFLVEIQNNRQEIEASSLIDTVTGMFNGRGLERQYQRYNKLGLAQSGRQFLLLIEVEGLEGIKPAVGEKQVLQWLEKLGEVIESSVTVRNIMACLSSNEFACLLQNVSKDEASQIAETIRKAVAAKEFDCATMETGKIGFKTSIGIAAADAHEGLRTLANRARISLNQAVSWGGNQCVVI